jgi:hypothetical protein
MQRQSGGETIMFLAEALKEAKNDDITIDSSQNITMKSSGGRRRRRIQIMGHVTSEPYSVLYQGEDYITFCLEDGTASVDVLYNHKQNHSFLQSTSPKKEQLLSFLSLPPLSQVKMGSCIDCKGFLQYVRSLDANHYGEKHEYNNIVPCFIVHSISFVVDPNIEVLRMTQLIHYGKKQQNWSNVSSQGTCNNIQERTLYMFGRGNVQQRTKVVDGVRLLHLIGVSRPKGLTRNELEVLFEIETEEDRRCLMSEIKALQSSYDIYVSRDGAYLPM